jgi:hypothetical protein
MKEEEEEEEPTTTNSRSMKKKGTIGYAQVLFAVQRTVHRVNRSSRALL